MADYPNIPVLGRVRPAFEPCIDDDSDRYISFASPGHLGRSMALYLNLGRAIAYHTGYSPAEVKDLLSRLSLSQGYVGRHPSKYDLIPCEEDGESQFYDDDDEPIRCSNVEPTTWAHLRLDPPSSDNSKEA